MNKRTRNLVTVGALTVISTILFFIGLYWLLGSPVLRGGIDVVVLLADGGGLKRSDQVLFQGVGVGSVRHVGLTREGGVVAELRLDGAFGLPADSRATVRGDVFGAHTVELIPGTSDRHIQDGDTITGVATPQLDDLATNLSARIEAVLLGADSLLSPDAIASVHSTAGVLPDAARELRAAFGELHAAAASLRRSTEGLESAGTGPSLARAIQEVERSAGSLAAAARNLDGSLATFSSVLGKVDRGEGTLGRLVNDSSLFLELNETLSEVRALATDIRQRPSRYIDLRIF